MLWYVGTGRQSRPRKPIRRIAITLLTFGALFGMSKSRVDAAGPSYDAEAEFSVTGTNPSGVWTNRHTDDLIRDGDYPLLPNFAANRGLFLPSPPGAPMYFDDTFQGIARCPAGCQLSAVSFVPIDADELWMHTGEDTGPQDLLGLTVVQFTAPLAGSFSISLSFDDIDADNGGDGIDWFVDTGTENLAAGTIKNSSSGPVSLSGVQSVPGENINFGISPKGSAFFDSTSLKATLTLEPEPVPSVTWLGMGTLLALMAAVVLWRRSERSQVTP
jgi:hypothetical protein